MPELILMRHAAAVPAAIDASDFERALSGAGRVEAVQAARQLAREAPAIDLILYSPAVRTRTTADIVAAELQLDPDAMIAMPSLYAATPDAIHDAIAREHGGAQLLLVVGHNPGISDFGREWLGSRGQLATAGFRRHRFDDEQWQALLRTNGR